MARKPNSEPEALPDTVNREALAEANAASQVMSAADMQVVAEAGLYRLVGRIEAAHLVETVSARVIAQAYLEARSLLGELGSIAVRDASAGVKRVSGLEEFCDAVMPVSARRCRQIVADYQLLGEQLYEQAERMGFRARDYQALKALPSDDQAAVKKALEGGSREETIDLLTELAARNDALRKKAAEHDKFMKAKQKVIDGKESKITELEEQLARRNSAEPDERSAAQIDAVRSASLAADQALRLLVGEAMATHAAPASELAKVAAGMSVEYVAQMFAELIHQSGLPFDFAQLVQPDWADLSRPFKRAGEPTLVTKAVGSKKR